MKLQNIYEMAVTTGAIADFTGGGGASSDGSWRSVFPKRKGKAEKPTLTDMPADNTFREVQLNDAKSGYAIQLIEAHDPYSGLKNGDIGTIEGFDGHGAMYVKWENGNVMPVMPGVDKFKIYEKQSRSAIKDG